MNNSYNRHTADTWSALGVGSAVAIVVYRRLDVHIGNIDALDALNRSTHSPCNLHRIVQRHELVHEIDFHFDFHLTPAQQVRAMEECVSTTSACADARVPSLGCNAHGSASR
jgi:hypothetical protein